MTAAGTIRSCAFVVILLGSAFSPVESCRAETAGGKDFATLQADVQKSFQENVSPFMTTYCIDCHGTKKRN